MADEDGGAVTRKPEGFARGGPKEEERQQQLKEGSEEGHPFFGGGSQARGEEEQYLFISHRCKKGRGRRDVRN